MPVNRPGTVTAAAVMAIIYASLTGLGALCGLGVVIAQVAMGPEALAFGDKKNAELTKRIEDATASNVPGYKILQIVSPIISALIAVSLLTASIGLLKLRSWSPKLAIIICLLAILMTTWQIVLSGFFIIPALDKVFEEGPPLVNVQKKGPGPQIDEAQLMKVIMKVSFIGSIAFSAGVIVYLLIIIILLLRPSAKVAFAGHGLAPEEDRYTPRETGYETDDAPDDRFRN